MQWFILRRHARHAWLWIIAGAVSAMAFGVLYGDLRGDNIVQFILGAGAQGAVTGLSLLWLYRGCISYCWQFKQHEAIPHQKSSLRIAARRTSILLALSQFQRIPVPQRGCLNCLTPLSTMPEPMGRPSSRN